MVELIPIGILIILIGVILLIVGIASKTKGKIEWAFGGFIGPIPFGAASREDLLKLIIFISVIFLCVFILLNLLGR